MLRTDRLTVVQSVAELLALLERHGFLVG